MTDLTVTPGSGQTVFALPYIPLGYQQYTSLASATALSSIPSGATMALIMPETSGVRYRDDGTNPTASAGMPLDPGAASLLYQGGAAGLAAIRFIQVAASAVLNVSYYK